MTGSSTGAGGASLRRRGLLVAAILLLGLGGGAVWYLVGLRSGADTNTGASGAGDPAALAAATYVGSEQCAACHEDATTAWRGSQHARAMQHATPDTVLGDFDEASFVYNGVKTRFSRRDGKFVVRTDGPTGELQEFEVKYTFGVYPLQQYLVELPGGHVQALPLAWDARPPGGGSQGWFHLYPDEKLDHRDELHWTKRQQNWNFMCADCHSTDVRKNYDAAGAAYATTFAEISVGCESCHGPGSVHLEWAKRKDERDATLGLQVQFHERRGVAWPRDPTTGQPRRSSPRAASIELDVCAQCHARRAQIAEGYRPGQPFLDHYLPSLVTAPLYHADGQQRDEVFIWGSWLQSRMHQAGVTCSDCHDPHSQRLRAPGNAVCAQCHDAVRYDNTDHHRHPQESTGAQCAGCHMPRTTYMVIDGRRDHSMRVPRPDQTVSLGVPNACNDCHRESTAQWAADQVRGWLGRDARGSHNFAAAFAAQPGDPSQVAPLRGIVEEPAGPAIVRASALVRLAESGAADASVVATAARDGDALVRLAAAGAADRLPPPERNVLTPLLRDERRIVRTEAARVMTPIAGTLPEDVQPSWQQAADEYVATLRYTADRPESNVALGTHLAMRGRGEEATAAFAAALRLDPTYEPAYVNAADVMRAGGGNAQAIALLRQGLERLPDAASLHHALGLALVRQQDVAGGAVHLARAAELAPDVPRYTYVHAVALDSLGRRAEAVRVLQAAAQRWPHDPDIRQALAAFDGG
jgi:predicted CXXCH cytochrome family protein